MTQLRTFAYGSNMVRAQMAVRCPGAEIVGAARLAGFRLVFNRYSLNWFGGVADVVPDDSSDVWGLVWNLAAGDLEALDDYEGFPEAYARKEAEVEIVETGELTIAWVYQVVNKSPFIPPRVEYLQPIVEAARELDFPKEYQRMLRDTRTASRGLEGIDQIEEERSVPD